MSLTLGTSPKYGHLVHIIPPDGGGRAYCGRMVHPAVQGRLTPPGGQFCNVCVKAQLAHFGRVLGFMASFSRVQRLNRRPAEGKGSEEWTESS